MTTTDLASVPAADDARSPVYAELELVVEQMYRPFVRDKIQKWNLLGTGAQFRVTDFYGREISYSGIGFDGSPRQVFWHGFAEPFLKDMIRRGVERGVKLADERGVDRACVLRDARGLMRGIVSWTDRAMHEVERNQLNRDRQTIHSRELPPIQWTDSQPMVARLHAFVDEIIGGWPIERTQAHPTTAAAAADAAKIDSTPRVDPEGLWAVVGGVRFAFKRGNQAQVVRLLYQKWMDSGGIDGCGLTEDALREAIGSAAMNFRVAATFHKHPAYGSIIRRVSKGTYALFFGSDTTAGR